MSEPQRVLGRIRLSRTTDESTSVDRQREQIEKWADLHGHTVVGWAVDTDVSGNVDPFKAPELGEWLDTYRDDWDILCAYRLDRLARRVIPLNRLFGWIMENGKTLATVSENIDLSNWVGRLVANVIGGVAEGELEAISERNQGSQKTLRQLGRWHGGTIPIGYRKVKHSDGWYLEVDEGRAPVVREIADRICDSESLQTIADDLNAREIPSPGKSAWTRLAITRVVRSRWILGQSAHKPESVRQREERNKIPRNEREPMRVVTDSEGMPVQFAEPLITFDQWQRVQSALANVSRPKNRRNGTGLLTGAVTCAECGLVMYHNVYVNRGVTYRSWLCGGRYKKKNGCPVTSVNADWLEGAVEENLITEIGELERVERVYEGGVSHADELATVEEAIETTRKEKDLGLYDGDQGSYLARLSGLIERRDALKAQDDRPSGFRWKGLGETYAQAWERMDTEERRGLLLDSGITVEAKQGYFHVHVPQEIIERSFNGYDAAEVNAEREAQRATARRGAGIE